MTMSVRMIEPRLRARLADGSLAGTWRLDAPRSTVRLKSRSMWGLAPVSGVFGEVSGEGVLAADGRASGSVTVASGSVDTKIKRRDEHLRSAEFFDSDAYPHILFTADRLTLVGDQVMVAGELRVRDQTRPLSFPVTITASGDDEVRVDAEVRIDRSDFGLTWSPMRMASMQNTITISAVFVRH
jgi:polyisoprenoid-binding protein YceI